MTRQRILVVEDDQAIRLFIESALKSAGYLVDSCTTVATACAYMQAQRPALLLLDLGLPDADGRTLITHLRSRSDMPILVLSARSQEGDIVSCLDLGADDYLVKPVGVAELLARVRVALRHALVMAQRDQVVSVGELVIDLHKGLVLLAGVPVHLTPKEYALLSILAQAQGQVITQRKLLAQVWGSEFVDYGHYVRVQMGNLRAKLERVAAEPRYILTEPGVGYRLAES
ncbi:MAG: response regulator [Thiotrichales bacterium]|jgi:two-component system KDP operon response regulator KdpE|nr:response regulator [Thiotrichales bacterium]